MNIKRLNLVDMKSGLASGQIDFTMDDGHFNFVSYEPHSWDNEGEVLDKNFFAKGSVKWDGCSHFTFNGEDYPNDNDSYYHICGVHYFVNHMRMLQFILEVASDRYGDKFASDERNELNKLRNLGLLKGYEIREVEIPEWELEDIVNELNK